jgi:hypothetical protein
MPFLIAVLFGGAIGLIRGGHFGNLARLTFRWSALVLLALGLQIFVIYGPGRLDARPYSLSALLILSSYGLLMVAVAANWQMPGMLLLGLGAALNFLVILVNGGWMPVTADHLAVSGLISASTALAPGQRVLYSKDLIVDSQEAHLRWLSDVFVIPRAGLLSMVFSTGDVLMMLGLFWLIQFGMVNDTG